MKQTRTLLCAALVGVASQGALAQAHPAGKAAVVAASAPGTATVAAAVNVSASVTEIDKATRIGG